MGDKALGLLRVHHVVLFSLGPSKHAGYLDLWLVTLCASRFRNLGGISVKFGNLCDRVHSSSPIQQRCKIFNLAIYTKHLPYVTTSVLTLNYTLVITIYM